MKARKVYEAFTLKGPSEDQIKEATEKGLKELDNLVKNGKKYNLEMEFNNFPVPEVSTNMNIKSITFKELVETIEYYLIHLFSETESLKVEYYRDYSFKGKNGDRFKDEKGNIIKQEDLPSDGIILPISLEDSDFLVTIWDKQVDIDYKNINYILMYKYGMYNPVKAWQEFVTSVLHGKIILINVYGETYKVFIGEI